MWKGVGDAAQPFARGAQRLLGCGSNSFFGCNSRCFGNLAFEVV